jgi:hypothetical protein
MSVNHLTQQYAIFYEKIITAGFLKVQNIGK